MNNVHPNGKEEYTKENLERLIKLLKAFTEIASQRDRLAYEKAKCFSIIIELAEHIRSFPENLLKPPIKYLQDLENKEAVEELLTIKPEQFYKTVEQKYFEENKDTPFPGGDDEAVRPGDRSFIRTTDSETDPGLFSRIIDNQTLSAPKPYIVYDMRERDAIGIKSVLVLLLEKRIDPAKRETFIKSSNRVEYKRTQKALIHIDTELKHVKNPSKLKKILREIEEKGVIPPPQLKTIRKKILKAETRENTEAIKQDLIGLVEKRIKFYGKKLSEKLETEFFKAPAEKTLS